MTRSMYFKCRAVVEIMPQINPSASPLRSNMAPMSVVRRRISSLAYCSVTPLRRVSRWYSCQYSR